MNSRGVYIRVGSTKRVASYDEMTRMVKMRYAHEYETRLCNRDDLTFDYLKKRLNEKGIEFDKNALSLVDKDGNYNNVALLFSDQNDTISKFAVFQGTDVEVFLDKKEFRGSLVEQLDNILYFASLSNRKKIIITGKPDHEEYLDIPKIALREAIVNCYCHRDWTLKGMVAKRNKITVEILDKLDAIENYASGVRRIFKDYIGFDKQPEYSISDNGIIVTLYNMNYNEAQNEVINDGINAGKKMNITERRNIILKLIEENENISAKQIIETINVSRPTIERDLKELKEQNKIEYIGSRKSGKWIIKE